MAIEATAVKAQLLTDDKKLSVEATCASKDSLLIRFLDGSGLDGDVEFDNLNILVNDKDIELGPCRFILEPTPDGYAGRLVCLGDSYGFERFIVSNIKEKLKASFVNLPTILAYKDNISPAFKDYTANLNYDLSVFKKMFDDLDAEHSDAPPEIREVVQKAIIETEGPRFKKFLDEKLEELAGLVAGFTREEHKRHGYYFRRQLWHFILCSDLIARGNLKPRGYSGDSKMMSMIYANDYRGESTFSKLLFKHSTEHYGAQAVRNRKKLVAEKVRELGHKLGDRPGGRLRILSVASGAAVEMADIFQSAEDCDKYELSLLDQDRLALAEAAELVEELQARFGTEIRVNYLNYSVRTMLASRQFREGLGQYDFIYSMGLFDYLTPRVAAAVLAKMAQVLKPGGEMIIGNFHVSNPSKYYMEYWLDWVLYYRTEDEFKSLVGENWAGDVDVFFEDTGCQMFLCIKN